MSKRSPLEKQLNYFSFYEKAPIITAGIILVFFFIWGIIDPCAFRGRILGIENGFLSWLVWFIIGAVGSVVVYFVMKIAFSYKLLTVHYLQKIAQQTPGKSNSRPENSSANSVASATNKNIN